MISRISCSIMALPAGGILPVGQLRHGFGDGGDDFIGIDRVGLLAGNGVFGKKAVDHIDDQAMQARPFLVFILIV